MTEPEYIAYFENLAKQHKAVLHTDDPKDQHFFVVKDDNRTEVENAIRNGLKFPAVLLDQYMDNLETDSDNYRLRIMGGISVLVTCTVKPEDIRRARDEARTIALSFLKRMRRDCLYARGALAMRNIKPDTTFQGEPVELLGSGTATGWGYPFEWLLPTQVVVDAGDWSDLTP